MESKVASDLNNLINQLGNFITTKTVVGEPMHIDGTILVPLIDVSFGAGAGSTASNKFIEKHKEKEKRVDGDAGASGSGIGAKVTPSAILVIQNGTTQLVNIRNQDSLTKIIDMVPGFVNKIADLFGKGKDEEIITNNEVTINNNEGTSEKKEEQFEDMDFYHDLDEN